MVLQYVLFLPCKQHHLGLTRSVVLGGLGLLCLQGE